MSISVLFYIFVVFTAIQFIYYSVFSTLFFKTKKKKSNSNLPVSVIIYAKNAENYMKENLPLFLNQQYENFQIVVVNNASYDDTSDILDEFKIDFPDLKIINIENNENFWGNKKYALTLGIKAAKHPHLLFSDVSCKPQSEHWISEMSTHFSDEKTIVIGYKQIASNKTFLNTLARYKNLTTSLFSFSFAKTGGAFAASKENMAYHRKTFFDVNGFIKHIKVFNGEGDLFIKDASTKKNTTICLEQNSFVTAEISYGFSGWISTLKRNISLQNKYKWKNKFFVFLFTFSKIATYVLGILLLFIGDLKSLILFLTYLLMTYIVLGLSTKKFKEPHLLFFIPFLEIFQLLLQISIFIAYLFSKPKS